MKLFYEYMLIFFIFITYFYHLLYPLHAENCDSNSRLVVGEDDNVKSGLKGLTLTARESSLTLESDIIRLQVVKSSQSRRCKSKNCLRFNMFKEKYRKEAINLKCVWLIF